METKKKLVLREGESHVSLHVLTDTLAHVLNGNVYQKNDLVVVRGLSWDEAGLRKKDGDTLVSPFDLELASDRVTGHRIAEEVPLEEAADVEDPHTAMEFFWAELRADHIDPVALAHEIRKEKEREAKERAAKQSRAAGEGDLPPQGKSHAA